MLGAVAHVGEECYTISWHQGLDDRLDLSHLHRLYLLEAVERRNFGNRSVRRRRGGAGMVTVVKQGTRRIIEGVCSRSICWR